MMSHVQVWIPDFGEFLVVAYRFVLIFQILPTLYVDSNGQNFQSLLLVQLIASGVIALLTLLLFRRQPEFPPSPAARARRLIREEVASREQPKQLNCQPSSSGLLRCILFNLLLVLILQAPCFHLIQIRVASAVVTTHSTRPTKCKA